MTRSYVRFLAERASWHVLAKVDDTGWWTRCGRNAGADARASDHLPLDEKTCESCLRLAESDEARKPL